MFWHVHTCPSPPHHSFETQRSRPDPPAADPPVLLLRLAAHDAHVALAARRRYLQLRDGAIDTAPLHDCRARRVQLERHVPAVASSTQSLTTAADRKQETGRLTQGATPETPRSALACCAAAASSAVFGGVCSAASSLVPSADNTQGQQKGKGRNRADGVRFCLTSPPPVCHIGNRHPGSLAARDGETALRTSDAASSVRPSSAATFPSSHQSLFAWQTNGRSRKVVRASDRFIMVWSGSPICVLQRHNVLGLVPQKVKSKMPCGYGRRPTHRRNGKTACSSTFSALDGRGGTIDAGR